MGLRGPTERPRELLGRGTSVDYFGSFLVGHAAPLLAAAISTDLGPRAILRARRSSSPSRSFRSSRSVRTLAWGPVEALGALSEGCSGRQRQEQIPPPGCAQFRERKTGLGRTSYNRLKDLRLDGSVLRRAA